MTGALGLPGAHCAPPARSQLLLILWRTIQDHDTLFVLAEVAHFVGVGLLGYKVTSKKSVAGERLAALPCGCLRPAARPPAAAAVALRVRRLHRNRRPIHRPGMREGSLTPFPATRLCAAGLSLQSQILTAVFLGVRLYCRWGGGLLRHASPPAAAAACPRLAPARALRWLARWPAAARAPAPQPASQPAPQTWLHGARSVMMEYDIHTLLDLAALAATGFVLYMMVRAACGGALPSRGYQATSHARLSAASRAAPVGCDAVSATAMAARGREVEAATADAGGAQAGRPRCRPRHDSNTRMHGAPPLPRWARSWQPL